jgi:hypothetical protein
MRFFAFIFGFYIMAVSLAPCTDMSEECDLPIAEASHAHEHDDSHHETCSPLCACSCCHSPAHLKLHTFKIKIPKPVVTTEKQYPSYDIAYISAFYGNIWQPPKISA